MRTSFPILLMWVLCSCAHKAQEVAPAEMTCDTAQVTYSGTIVPILRRNCALAGCHVPGGDGTGDFTTYSGLITQVDNDNLIPAIQHTSGAIPMPPDGSSIPDCAIQQIITWVEQGAQENQRAVVRPLDRPRM